MLSGRILEARVYPRALSQEEVAQAWLASNNRVSHEMLLTELTADQQLLVNKLEQDAHRLEEALRTERPPSNAEAWVDFAHSLFNMTEFMYVR